MMEMKDLGDALIGDLDAGVGISVEERKRLTIGMELVAKPRILFLVGKPFFFLFFSFLFCFFFVSVFVSPIPVRDAHPFFHTVSIFQKETLYVLVLVWFGLVYQVLDK